MLNHRLALAFAACSIAGLSCTAQAAPPDQAPKKDPAAASDNDGKPIPKRAPSHHVQPSAAQRDIDALKAEVQRLRAEAAMCREGAGKK